MNEFPRTYIDAAAERPAEFGSSVATIKDISASGGSGEQLKTGTTIVALTTRDRSVGVIASDGRVTLMPSHGIADSKFKKILSCRIGFIGTAGTVRALQIVVPAFNQSLGNISDRRKVPMTASGAAQHLFHFAQHAATPDLFGQFLALFYDFKDKKCRIYQVDAGSSLRRYQGYGSIGSGSGTSLPYLDNKFRNTLESLPETKEGLFEEIRYIMQRVKERDSGTGGSTFYGVVDNGRFYSEEEADS